MNTRRLAHLFAALAAIISIAPALALPQTASFQRPASASASQVYLPLAVRQGEPRGLIVAPAQLRATKALADQGFEPSRGAVITLLRTADKALAVQPCAVAVYSTLLGAECLNQSAQYAFALALAFHLTGDGRYSAQSAAFIRVWATTLTAINTVDDSQAALDWSRLAPTLIWAADLLEGAPGWTDGDRRLFADMLLGKVLDIGKGITNRPNNWADAGNLVWLSIAIYADLPDERADAVASWKLKLDGVLQPDGAWESGMAPDGSLPEENRRAEKGLQYNQGALSLKTVFAEMLRRHGDGSLYTYTTPRNVGLKNGWDFLAAQVVSAYNHENSGGPCTWPFTADHCVDYANKSAWEIAYARWHAPAYLDVITLDRPYQWSNAADPSYSTLLFANLDLSAQ
jgi:hypothetical protein